MLANAARQLGAKRVIVACFACIAFLLLCFQLLYPFSTGDSSLARSEHHPATNQTLGFGAIYVLTEDTRTWRVQGLRQAAKFTDLSLTIPVQPRRPDNEVYDFLGDNKPTRFLNEIRAVLNYVSLLETFLASGLETALFLEDDIDFGVDIKDQLGRISQAILTYQGPGIKSRNATDVSQSQDWTAPRPYPYGNDYWDIFWIGYFGIEFTSRTEEILYEDPHALPWDHLTSDFNNFYELEMQHAESAHRPQQILKDVGNIGSYAFALNRKAAERLIKRLRNQHEEQFDRSLLSLCKGFELRCMAPAPGLMHHHKVPGQKAIATTGTQDDGKHDLKWWRERHKYTYNIEWSARCNAAKVGEKIGNRWQCMPGKYDKNS